MWSILLILIIGITIGSTINFSEKFIKLNGKLQYVGVIILLFTMGISLGLNKSLLTKLNSIGIIALTFAILTSFFSIILVYLVTKNTLKGEK
ncbi:MAG: hypothetical protein U9N10_09030 [Bacillota bacterium]|nr:hypothetical protein [Bacillota bacterium]